MTNELYPPKNSFLYFDDRKAAKYASPLSIMGFADFETKLELINCKDNLENSFDIKESFTKRKNVHKIVSFSLIFVDNNGKLLFEKYSVEQMLGKFFLKS